MNKMMIKQERVEDLYAEYCAKAHEEIFGNNQIAELKQQLTEKDKEIEELKSCIMSKEQVEAIIKKETDNIKQQVIKDATPIIYKECRHQICERIKKDFGCGSKWNGGWIEMKEETFLELLDQIEKGK